ncbi:hypothetical protein Clocel_2040 [Clostridium cellulovorans 743B]|uniref:Uncharacterized protein n=1 Tax=Clostridium cellulovorans (strain ATCC 35296 / DSM 3052 / OCM 3 / 743B) TaxID=573061 RepID=D9SM52_CLOC7|nr:hypothetical protein Clocel_2040 [Clostridium cellulovorans 743B]
MNKNNFIALVILFFKCFMIILFLGYILPKVFNTYLEHFTENTRNGDLFVISKQNRDIISYVIYYIKSYFY